MRLHSCNVLVFFVFVHSFNVFVLRMDVYLRTSLGRNMHILNVALYGTVFRKSLFVHALVTVLFMYQLNGMHREYTVRKHSQAYSWGHPNLGAQRRSTNLQD